MIQASAEFRAFLYDANVQQFADLYTFTFRSGTIYWTPARSAISWDGHTFTPIVISRGKVRSTARLEIDKLSLTLTPGDATLGGVSLRIAALQGKFHGVRVKLERCGFDVNGTVVGAVTVFDGTIDDVATNSVSIGLQVKSILAFLAEAEIPKRVIEAECGYAFCSSECTLSAASFTTTETVLAGSSASAVWVSATHPAHYWQLGTVTIGGETRMVRDSSDLGGGVHSLTLTASLSTDPTPGASASVMRGCPKTRDACRAFSNILNFGGFPDLPPPEAVY